MKKIECLERHAYAPELNKLWFTDGTYASVPQATTIEQAEKQLDKNTLEVLGEWSSVAEASHKTNSNCHHIANVALGKRKTHNGFKWRYV